MFLRNYDNMMVLYHFTTDYTSTHNTGNELYINNKASFGDGNINVKRSDGSVAGFVKDYHANFNLYIAPLSPQNICIGTGNTPVTYDDYTLSGEIIDNTKLSYVSYEINYDAEGRKVSKTVTYTYTNETDSNITISEWGLFRHWITAGSGNSYLFSNSAYDILFYREVLETPITIEPGTSATLKFKIDIPINHP